MKPEILEDLRRMMRARIGISDSHLEEGRLLERLTQRARELGLDSCAYARLLERSELEREEVSRLFLNGESFFFRDDFHMQALRHRLLPELIRENEKLGLLRLWSAGCSTGEEAYTLAMLAHEALSMRDDFERWRVLVLGTDLNRASLERARQGVYPPWSLRGVPSFLRERYFHRVGADWRVAEAFRDCVRLSWANLLEDPPWFDVDLIVCRNVFIYMDPAAIQKVLHQLQSSLRPGGHLIAGHAEVGPTVPELLESRRLGRVLVYRKRSAARVVVPVPAPVVAATPRSIPPPRSEAPTLTRSAPPLPQYEVEARRLADRGQYDEARQLVLGWLEQSPLEWRAHFLLAELAQIQGRLPEAIGLLKKVLYLRPSCAAAYLELSELHRLQGDLRKSRRLREVMRGLLLSLPVDSLLEPLEVTAGDVLSNLDEA